MLKTLALIFLALPAFAGNLGAADSLMYGVREMAGPLEVKSKYSVHPGRFRTRNDDAAIAEFVNGLFWIRTSPEYVEWLKKRKFLPENFVSIEKGISPGQVLSFDYHASHPVIVFSVLYEDDSGALSQASWNFKWADQNARSFRHSFLKWLNTGTIKSKIIPPDGADSDANP